MGQKKIVGEGAGAGGKNGPEGRGGPVDPAGESGGKSAIARRLVALAGTERLLWAPVILGLGIGLYFALPVEPSVGLTTGLLVAALLARMVLPPTGNANKTLVLGIIIIMAGVVLAGVRTLYVAGPVIAKETRPLTLSGQIIRVERRTDKSLRLLLQVGGLSGVAASDWPQRARVSVRTAAPPLFPGDRVSMRAILTPPPQPVLPGGYDFARSAWFQRIGALGFSISAVTRLATRPTESLEIRVEGFRDAIAGRVTRVLEGDAGGLAVALITGLRGGLSDQVQDNMRAAGLAHLLAISGLHMALVTGVIFFGLRALLALSPVLALEYPIKKIAAVAAWLGAIFYLQLSGAGISTERAFIMVSIVLLAVLVERRAISMRLVALAATLVLVRSPEALLSASFQMSFAAVAGLVAGFEWQQQKFGAILAARRGPLNRAALYLWGSILATLIAEASIGPVAAFHFHRVALFGIPANIIAMPLMSFWIMPLAVLAMLLMPLGLEAAALVPMGWGLDLLLGVAGDVAALPGAVRSIPAMPFASFLLLVAGGLWLVLVRAGGLRRLALLPMLLAALPVALAEKPDVLIGRGGKIFAVRDGAGDYAISSRRAGRFTRRVWLETYGQRNYALWPPFAALAPRKEQGVGRAGAEGAGNPGGNGAALLRCDPVACIYNPAAAQPGPGVRAETGADMGAEIAPEMGAEMGAVAFVARREGFAEECARAGVLVSVHFAPRNCAAPGLVIDGRVMRAAGAMTLSWRAGEWQMTSVAGSRGDRPWTGAWAKKAIPQAQ